LHSKKESLMSYTEGRSLYSLYYTDCIIVDGTDASRRAIRLRIAIRFLSGASRLAIKRLQRTAVPASKLASTSAADPQPVIVPDV